MSPLAIMFSLVLVSGAITVAMSLPLMGTLLQRSAERRRRPAGR